MIFAVILPPMKFPFKRTKKQSHRPSPPKKGGIRRRLIILADTLLILLSLVSVSAAGVWVWQTTRVITREDPAPKYQVRLQIVNATGQPGIAKIAANRLMHYGNKLIEISVVDTDDLNATRLAKSFVISRDGNAESAAGLALRLSIPANGIASRILDHNTHQVTTTLVLGEDWHKLTLPNL
jgi:LytR cell envelope-related transcriptional attenuator